MSPPEILLEVVLLVSLINMMITAVMEKIHCNGHNKLKKPTYLPSCAERSGGQNLLNGKIKIQVEILYPWRYAAIIAAPRMSQKTRGTGIDRI